MLYILDEPSIGLHLRDNKRLLSTLESLRNLGNTVIVVEHDESTIRACDWIVDLGPGAGKLGGEVIYEPYLVSRRIDIVRNISENWLKIDKYGDHNFDGICNGTDYSMLLSRWENK